MTWTKDGPMCWLHGLVVLQCSLDDGMWVARRRYVIGRPCSTSTEAMDSLLRFVTEERPQLGRGVVAGEIRAARDAWLAAVPHAVEEVSDWSPAEARTWIRPNGAQPSILSVVDDSGVTVVDMLRRIENLEEALADAQSEIADLRAALEARTEPKSQRMRVYVDAGCITMVRDGPKGGE